MKDIPFYLVLLENNDITAHDAEAIEKLDWFCLGHLPGIFVSDEELTKIIGEHDCAAIFDVYRGRTEEILKIDNCLKRWNDKDGFYHA